MTSSLSGSEVSEEVSKHIRRAGPYLLGQKLGNSPVKSIAHCLARKDLTDDFYTMKILTLKNEDEQETIDDQQGRILLHTEYTLLNLLKGYEGVVQVHGLYKDVSVEQKEVNGRLVSTGKLRTRLCLVLDCHNQHDFSPRYTHLTNLQYYVIKEKKLTESEAIRIFYKVVQIVKRLHDLNVVHRDLKLGNFILNKNNGSVTIANFCLGKHLSSDDDVLRDQRGSPAYISPDVILGKPYLGKPSDMWALGVVLYTMLYGTFPFYDASPSELFKKIKTVDYSIPIENNVSNKSIELIRSLLVLEPSERLTASQVLEKLEEILSIEQKLFCDSDLQVVPMGPQKSISITTTTTGSETVANRGVKRTHSDDKSPEKLISDVEALLTKDADADEESNNAESKTVHEPPKKVAKTAPCLGSPRVKITRVKDDARVLTIGDLQKLHTIYLANKAKQQRTNERNNSNPGSSTSSSSSSNPINNENRNVSSNSNETSTSTSSNANANNVSNSNSTATAGPQQSQQTTLGNKRVVKAN